MDISKIKDIGASAALSAAFMGAVSFVGAKWSVGLANHVSNPYFAQVIAENGLPVTAVTAGAALAIMIGQIDGPVYKKKAALYGTSMLIGAALLSHISGDEIVSYPKRVQQAETIEAVEMCSRYTEGFFKPAFCP